MTKLQRNPNCNSGMRKKNVELKKRVSHIENVFYRYKLMKQSILKKVIIIKC